MPNSFSFFKVKMHNYQSDQNILFYSTFATKLLDRDKSMQDLGFTDAYLNVLSMRLASGDTQLGCKVHTNRVLRVRYHHFSKLFLPPSSSLMCEVLRAWKSQTHIVL